MRITQGTFSYLPDLTDEEITAQVQYALDQGWPLSVEADHFKAWQDGMTILAGLGERIHCKLSGLVMTVNDMSVGALRPWIERSIEIFGVDRCFFASNFPVDGLYGSFDQLYGAYDEITTGLSQQERNQLFATNAERVYRC